MSLKSLILSWLLRRDAKPEEVPMTEPMNGAETAQAEGSQVPAAAEAPVAPAVVEVVPAAAFNPDHKVDTFAENLRHLLNLAEVEVGHLWDEAVALAKKLV